MEPGLRRGELIKWKDDRGFGFIQPAEGGKEVFLHISELRDTTNRPQVGDTIDYHLGFEAGKARASKASIVSANVSANRPVPPKAPTRDAARAYTKADNTGSTAETFPLRETLLLAAIPFFGMARFFGQTSNPLPLIAYTLMSLATYALYADDKSRARQGSWRISEKTLHLCEFLGGWPGGFIAQRKLHHKNRKQSYQITFWAIVVFHQVLCLSWLVGWA